MRALVVLAAVVFKVWFVYRMMTPEERAHVIFIVACWLLVVVMAAIWMQRNEPVSVNELYCSDKSQSEHLEERCEFKLRSVRTGASRSSEVMFAAKTI